MRGTCPACGLETPLKGKDDKGEEIEYDACFGSPLRGVHAGTAGGACCGHGDLSKAYVRVTRMDGNTVDLCGIVVQPYGAYRGDFGDQYPPKNVIA